MAGQRARFAEHLREHESSDRRFGLFAAGCMAAIVALRVVRTGTLPMWAVALAIFFLLLTSIAPSKLRSIKRAWLFLGFALGLVVNPVVLAVLFYGVLTPVGTVSRLLRRDPLRLRRDAASPTYWLERESASSDMSLQF